MLSTLLLVTLGSSSPSVVPASANYLLALAPEEAVCVLAIDSLDELRESTRKNSFFRFGCDEQVASFVDHFAGQAIKEAPWNYNLKQILGADIDVADVISSLHGAVVFFSELPDHNPEKTVAGLMIELNEDRSDFDQLFSSLVDRVGAEASITGSEYSGVHLTTIVPSNPKSQGALLVAELGDAVVLMGGAYQQDCREQLKGIIDRWSGASTTGGLLQCEQFREARSSLDFPAGIELNIDIRSLWKTLLASGELDHEEIPEVLLDEIGNIQWLHGGLRIGEGEELDFQIGLALPEEGILASFRGLFGGIPIDILKQVPRQSSRFSCGSMDTYGLFTMVTDILHSLDEEIFAEYEAYVAVAGGMGFDIEADFLSQLTGGCARFTVEVPSSESLLGMAGAMAGAVNGSDPTPTYASAVLIGIEDSNRLESAVNRLVQTFGSQLAATSVVDGHELQILGEPGLVALYWSFTPHSLILSMQPTPVVEALRMLSDDAPSILDKGRFAEHIKANRRATHFSICDTGSNLRTVLSGVQRVSRMLPLISAFTGWKVPSGFPIGPKTPWPAPSIVGRYFEGTILTAVTWDENSLRFKLSSN